MRDNVNCFFSSSCEDKIFILGQFYTSQKPTKEGR